jgi:aminoglycoside phosphotransferase (APT) family kinase protein
LEFNPAPPRPRTSTRDPAEFSARLEAWLAKRHAGARISGLTTPASNGMSSETLLFDAEWSEHGTTHRRRCVARLPPDQAAMPVFPQYDLYKQFRVMQIARERTTVPVPEMLWHEPDAEHLGAPFIVMERVDGEAPPDIPPYVFDSWLLRASPAEQRRLQDAALRTLAQLHKVPLSESELEFLRPANGSSALRRHVEALRAYYAWVSADGIRHPLVERGFEWIEANWPAQESPEVLSWGDARIGNMLWRDFEPTAVLDWEMVATAPLEVDLGWMIYLHHFFQDFTTWVGVPGIPGMMRLDEAVATYTAAAGHAPRDMGFYTTYAALRHAVVMARATRRTVHFGEAQMPADPDDLILHRASLEAMMAGTYWDTRR